MNAEVLRVDRMASAAESYPVFLGEALLAEASECIEPSRFDKIFILFDPSVQAVAEQLAPTLGARGRFALAGGEASKSFAQLEAVLNALLAAGLTRSSLLVNVGGGVLSDVGAFAAAVYMRGIAYVNVPTTLLGMVDASLGGKSGCNFNGIKNMIGCLHHPRAVLMDVDTLKTLPKEHFREGLVEVVKIAAVRDAAFFSWLETALEHLFNRDTACLLECVSRAVALKAAVVAKDASDASERVLLNFGHSVGHALELLSNFDISHGAAVSIGMLAEARLAGGRELPRLRALLARLGMPLDLPTSWPLARWRAALQKDKKLRGLRLRYAALECIGEAHVRDLALEDFLSGLSLPVARHKTNSSRRDEPEGSVHPPEPSTHGEPSDSSGQCPPEPSGKHGEPSDSSGQRPSEPSTHGEPSGTHGGCTP